jgi:hypothetical protein
MKAKSRPLLNAEVRSLSGLRTDRSGIEGKKKLCSYSVTIRKDGPPAFRKWAGETVTFSVYATSAAESLGRQSCPRK